MQDVWTRWPELVAIPDMKAVTVADGFTRHWVCRHGTPKTVIMDRGPQFIAEFTQEVVKNLEVDATIVVRERHQSNPVERSHRTINSILKTTIDRGQRHWDQQLPFTAFALRAYDIGTLGASPFRLLKGMDAPLPADTWLAVMVTHQDEDEWLEAQGWEFRRAATSFNIADEKCKKKNAMYYQRKVKPHPPGALRVGADIGVLRRQSSGLGLAGKLKPGPYRLGWVIRTLHGNGIITVEETSTGKVMEVHPDNIRFVKFSSDPAFWARREKERMVHWEDTDSEEVDPIAALVEPEETAEGLGLSNGCFLLHRTEGVKRGWALGRLRRFDSPEVTAVELHRWTTEDVSVLQGVYKPVWMVTGSACPGTVRAHLSDIPEGHTAKPDSTLVGIAIKD
jgi:hypothetical protein